MGRPNQAPHYMSGAALVWTLPHCKAQWASRPEINRRPLVSTTILSYAKEISGTPPNHIFQRRPELLPYLCPLSLCIYSSVASLIPDFSLEIFYFVFWNVYIVTLKTKQVNFQFHTEYTTFLPWTKLSSYPNPSLTCEDYPFPHVFRPMKPARENPPNFRVSSIQMESPVTMRLSAHNADCEPAFISTSLGDYIKLNLFLQHSYKSWLYSPFSVDNLSPISQKKEVQQLWSSISCLIPIKSFTSIPILHVILPDTLSCFQLDSPL